MYKTWKLDETELKGKKIKYRIEDLSIENVFEGKRSKIHKGVVVDKNEEITREEFYRATKLGFFFSPEDVIRSDAIAKIISSRILEKMYNQIPYSNQVISVDYNGGENEGILTIDGEVIFLEEA